MPDYSYLCVPELEPEEFLLSVGGIQRMNSNLRDDYSEEGRCSIVNTLEKRLFSYMVERRKLERIRNAEMRMKSPEKLLKEDFPLSAKNPEGHLSLQQHMNLCSRKIKPKPELDEKPDVDVHACLKNKVRYALLRNYITFIRQIYHMRKETGIDTVVFTPEPSIWRQDLCSFQIQRSDGIPVERLSPESEELDTKIEDMDKYCLALREKGLYKYDDVFWYFYISRNDGPPKMHLLFSIHTLEAADVERLLVQETTE